MDDKNSPRPVSGEIVADSVRPAPSRPADDPQIIDAEYETLSAAEPDRTRREARRPHDVAYAPSAAAISARGLDILRRDARSVPARRPARAGAAFWTIGLFLVAAAFWASGGHAIVDIPSPVGAGRAAEPIRIASVESRIVRNGGHATLVVDGEAVNESAESRRLPAISINVLGKDGRTTRFLLGTNGQFLHPGGRFPFSGRMTAPEVGVRSVSATLLEVQD